MKNLKQPTPAKGKQYTGTTLRRLLVAFVRHRERIIQHPTYANPQRKMRQLKATKTIRMWLAHRPGIGTQRMINMYYLLRAEIRELLYSESSRFQRKRQEIESILDYAEQNHTCI